MSADHVPSIIIPSLQWMCACLLLLVCRWDASALLYQDLVSHVPMISIPGNHEVGKAQLAQGSSKSCRTAGRGSLTCLAPVARSLAQGAKHVVDNSEGCRHLIFPDLGFRPRPMNRLCRCPSSSPCAVTYIHAMHPPADKNGSSRVLPQSATPEGYSRGLPQKATISLSEG